MKRLKLFIVFQFLSFYSLFMPDDSMQIVDDHLSESEKRRKAAAIDRIFKQRSKNKEY